MDIRYNAGDDAIEQVEKLDRQSIEAELVDARGELSVVEPMYRAASDRVTGLENKLNAFDQVALAVQDYKAKAAAPAAPAETPVIPTTPELPTEVAPAVPEAPTPVEEVAQVATQVEVQVAAIEQAPTNAVQELLASAPTVPAPVVASIVAPVVAPVAPIAPAAPVTVLSAQPADQNPLSPNAVAAPGQM